ncbi:MAG: hypothetical protein ISR90_04010 [Candidatus Marinimicrobia bacterium]|nr:hypothetical protein [Candidatus Neomarinimicrobiota bacterium]
MGVDKVEFLIDGQVIATDTEEPWEYLWQVSYYADDATHSILAKATDEAENIGQSDLVRVFVSENAEETPTPFSPANGEILADTNIVALIWSILAGGEEYIVLVSSNPEFTDTEYSITTSDTTVTTDALADGYHYWKVRAKNSVGNYGEWSNYFTFEITGPESPTLLSPDNGEVISDAEIAELVWSASEFAVTYDVIVSSSYNFTDTEYSITTTDTTVTTDALVGGYHYWKVRAKNSVGNYGEWSNYFTFEITGPEAPVLLSPENGEVISNAEIAELVWSASEFAVTYDVIVSSSYNFTDTEYSITTSDTTVTTDALSIGVHYWKVRAKNSVGNYGEWSNYFTFEINFPSPSNLTTTVISDSEIELNWTDNCSYESGFKLERKTDSGEFTQVAELEADVTEFTDSGLSLETNYTYRVLAFTDVNNSNYSNTTTILLYNDCNNNFMGSAFINACDCCVGGNTGLLENYCDEIMTDADGNEYETISIGDQIWTTTNLKVTHYRNGDAIPTGYSNSEWEDLGSGTGAYCVYNDQESNADTYGYLYSWYAVNDSRNIAPEGWHIPTDDEWQTFIDYLGGESVAGGKMKETGIEHWNSPNTSATNESGFTALPGGYRYGYGGYYDAVGNRGCFWTTSHHPTMYVWSRNLYYDTSEVARGTFIEMSGLSVRLVRD